MNTQARIAAIVTEISKLRAEHTSITMQMNEATGTCTRRVSSRLTEIEAGVIEVVSEQRDLQ